jgi:uncharacterized protein
MAAVNQSLDVHYPRHQRLAQLVSARLPEAELAHDALHIERVYAWAMRLALECGVAQDLVGAAALVHDCVSIPKDSLDRPLGGERSAQLAAGLLPEAGYSSRETAAVVEAVRTCSWSRGLTPTSVLGRVLQDADRLDAIGVLGILRATACAQYMAPRTAGTLYDGGDPLALRGRSLDDKRAMLDHIDCKLVHLAGSMHSQSARLEGAVRHQRMLNLRAQLASELVAVHQNRAEPFEGFLLDFDGTLVDSAPAIVSCLRHAAHSAGVSLAEDDEPLRRMIGQPLAEGMRAWNLDDGGVERAVAAYREMWFAGACETCQLFPGARETLLLLKERGVRLILATAKNERGLEVAVRRVGLEDIIDVCCGARDGEGDKVALVARAREAAGESRVAMVGDRCYDGQAAAHWQIPFLAARYGYGDVEELNACQPRADLGHVSDLLQLGI